jgi:hypothetical protein
MYMGLIKRGLAAMCGFFLLVYLLTLVTGSVVGGPLTLFLWLAMVVFFLTCTFDGFNIRRRLLNGEEVTDNIDDVIAFFQRHKKTLLVVILLCIGLGVMGSIITAILRPLMNLVPLLIIGLGIYLVFRKNHKT